jgi:hypothetical protein
MHIPGRMRSTLFCTNWCNSSLSLVVHPLNLCSLYSRFDELLEGHDVYKIETIGVGW